MASLREKLDNLEDKYINDKIEESTYKKWKPAYLRELHEKIDRVEEMERDKSAVINIIASHTHLLTNLGSLYEKATSKDKQKLLKTVFQSSLTCFRGFYETPYISDVFIDNALKTNLLRIKKDVNNNVFNVENRKNTLFEIIMKLKE